MRPLSVVDKLICELDTALRTLVVPPHRSSNRRNPANDIAEAPLSSQDKRHVARLIRVNHAGEVSAQALYQGQALTAKLTTVKAQMIQAAEEEVDHLAWCEARLQELGGKPSLLNPLWYGSSLLLGALAGLAGDHLSLGFVAETENQVTAHLEKHRQQLPAHDLKTSALLKKMQDDEAHHADTAKKAGAIELPYIIKQLMSVMSTLLTKGSYYI